MSLNSIVDVISNNYKVSSGCLIGLDGDICHNFSDTFWLTYAYDFNTDWAWKIWNSIEDKSDMEKMFFSNEAELLEDLEYFEREFDVVYIHNRGQRFTRDVFNYFISKSSKFILTHPQVIANAPPKYHLIKFSCPEGDYKLFYLDILHQEIEKVINVK